MISIRAGEIIEIDIPAGATYQVEEVDCPGFIASYDENKSGKIESNETIRTAITNTYDPIGSFSFAMAKQARGFTLSDNQFSFLMLDTNGQIVSTARNNEAGEISFDEINVTQDMLDGNGTANHIYRIVEVDDNQNGISYDGRECIFTVQMRDNGLGIIEYSPTWTWASDDTSNIIDPILGNDADNMPTFINTMTLSLPLTGFAAWLSISIAMIGIMLIATGYMLRWYGRVPAALRTSRTASIERKSNKS